jgi:hypothetical protein
MVLLCGGFSLVLGLGLVLLLAAGGELFFFFAWRLEGVCAEAAPP